MKKNKKQIKCVKKERFTARKNEKQAKTGTELKKEKECMTDEK